MFATELIIDLNDLFCAVLGWHFHPQLELHG